MKVLDRILERCFKENIETKVKKFSLVMWIVLILNGVLLGWVFQLKLNMLDKDSNKKEMTPIWRILMSIED